MRAHLRDIAGEVRPTLALAGPVVLGQLGLMLMTLVDTAMVGRLGPGAITAVGVGHATSVLFLLFGLGVLSGLDRIVSFAHGAGRPEEIRRALVQGLLLSVAFSVPAIAIQQVLAAHLGSFGYAPEIARDAAPFLGALAWSLLPSLLFTALRQTLQATGDATAASLIVLAANGVNLAANELLIYGSAYTPALGVTGSGWATLISRVFMLVALTVHAGRQGLLGRTLAAWAPELARLRELVRLGVPAGVQLVFEGGVFALVSMLAARLGAVPGAANQIVLQIASFTFMVPLGLGAAGAVRVGQALGRGDAAGARRAGWTAVTLGVGFMGLSGLGLLVAHGPLLAIFQPPPEVIAVARELLVCAALFQLFDGAQVAFSGVLRGVANTVAPMVANLVGHWAIGLPTGLAFAYGAGLGVLGLWVGLAAGLAAVAVALGVVWKRDIGRIVRGESRLEGAIPEVL